MRKRYADEGVECHSAAEAEKAVGAKEAESGTVSVRNRDTGDTEEMSLDAFMSFISEKIKNRD